VLAQLVRRDVLVNPLQLTADSYLPARWI
jgi:hypothetical protein